jgi:ADP-ribosylglycohydrolase
MENPTLNSMDRALGAMYGQAIGDALGMPTHLLSRAEIKRLYGALEWFERAPEDSEYGNNVPAGRITDDTEQALIVADLLIEGDGHIDLNRFGQRLQEWAPRIEARGGDQLGPSTRRALEALGAGLDPDGVSRRGDTNGAAMRISPVGIAVPPEPLDRLVDRVEEACRLTHNTGIAIAGAAAVAAAVSTGVAGGTVREALGAGQRAALIGTERGHYRSGASVPARIEWARRMVATMAEDDALDFIYELVGTGIATQEAVPAAFALASLSPEDPWRACLLTATIGGDCDTIGAMVGAIVGSCQGAKAFPNRALAEIDRVNEDIDLSGVAHRLMAVRSSF